MHKGSVLRMKWFARTPYSCVSTLPCSTVAMGSMLPYPLYFKDYLKDETTTNPK